MSFLRGAYASAEEALQEIGGILYLTRKTRCSDCGNEWEQTVLMVNSESLRECPNCGKWERDTSFADALHAGE